MDIKFIEAEIKDLEAVCELSFQFYEITNADNFSKNIEESIKELLLNPSYGKIWLIKDEEKAVGYIILTFGFSIEYKGRDALIDELFIIEFYRNRGIGKTALELVDKYSRSNGIKAIHLEVKEKHQKAKLFYARGNFKEHKSIFMTKLL